jgi:hypothetical protein
MLDFIKVKTVSDLKYNVVQTGSFFFNRKTMRFFGDSMGNYAVSSKTVTYKGVECYELRRKRAVSGGGNKCHESTFFDAATFQRVI